MNSCSIRLIGYTNVSRLGTNACFAFTNAHPFEIDYAVFSPAGAKAGYLKPHSVTMILIPTSQLHQRLEIGYRRRRPTQEALQTLWGRFTRRATSYQMTYQLSYETKQLKTNAEQSGTDNWLPPLRSVALP